MNKIILKKNEERRINNGHLWIFSNEIEIIDGDAENGDVVEVYDSKNNLLGSGFYNKNSLISVRILSRKKIDDLQNLFKEKILQAYQLRKLLYLNRESFRLAFSESDFLPGLIIDKYNNTFVLQVYSSGMQKNILLIKEILQTEFSAENIFTKNEEYFRILEGLIFDDEILLGEKKEETINDGKISYKINFEKGHKTGFYFDQNNNRFFIRNLVKDKTVIDAFCNAGGFGMHAVDAGAESIKFIDSSSIEIESAKTNYELNNLKTKAEFFVSDVFDFFEKDSDKYDFVIIDPPAFAKNKKSLSKAKKGYERLNKLAINRIKSGGFLAASSCSYHLLDNEFIQIVNTAAEKSGKKVQLIYFNNASLDHPKIPAMPETSYLKFGVFRIV